MEAQTRRFCFPQVFPQENQATAPVLRHKPGSSQTVNFLQMMSAPGRGGVEGRTEGMGQFSSKSTDESSFYTVANVPLGLASNLRVGRFSEINKILLYNRGYGVTKRVRIPMEKKSPTNHLWLKEITHKSPMTNQISSSASTGPWLCKTWPGTWSH